MVKIEENILEVFNGAVSTAEYVDLLVAAQIVGSDVSYQKALDALKAAETKPDLAQARRIGAEAIHAIMMANIGSGKCRHCCHKLNYCGQCAQYQN
jgi:hypothetical protein